MRLGLTGKLWVWCLGLVVVFGATIGLMLWRVEGLARDSGDLVRVNYGNLRQSEALIDDLFGLMESQRRYEILHKPEDLEAARQTWRQVGAGFQAWLGQAAEPRLTWEHLAREWSTMAEPAPGALAPEGRLGDWIDDLDQVQRQMRAGMAEGLVSLEEASQDAHRLGLIGLMLSGGLALGGSLLLALYLGRSLAALRRGVAQVGEGGSYRPIGLTSRDELGELSRAFDRMAEQLQEEERLRAEFIATLSHEIRTPLTSIREAVNLVREGVLGPVVQRQAEFLAVADREGQRLAGLLERLMQVSSLEARDLVLEIRPVAAAELLADAKERLAAAALARGVELRVEPAPELRVAADPDQVRQVLLNLVGNALKFSPGGGGVRLSLAEGQGEAIFGVGDDGPGIPDQEQAFVFQKYYRGRALKDRVDGVGLGLNLSQRIIAAHGGRMWLISQAGQGSVFYFSLPLARD